VAVLVSLSCAASVLAQEKTPRWTTRLFGSLYLVPNEPETMTRPQPKPLGSGVVESVTLELNGGWGMGFGLEYRLTEHLFGIELGVMAANLGTRVTWNTDLGPVVNEDPVGAIVPLTAAANFHLLNAASPADFYVAALIAYTLFDQASAGYVRGDRVTLEDSFGIGFDLGFSYSLSGGPFLINAIVRYLAPQTVAKVSFEEVGEEATRHLQFSPLILNLGLGYRF
jgi:outer membrane protein W